ncbi:MAG: aminomethyl-transferring glycine dehydrogenase subunit GcvPA [Deltaproteobacteria bacterium]|nr:aminomethyl-transferring glycine dehydrogenase subunit GcvPA [Deltaproteobacteria bacterium]
MRYTPHTSAEIAAMLRAIGAESVDALLAHVPEALRARASLAALPGGMDERAMRAELAALAARNRADGLAFLGAGAYPHFIPAAVEQIAGRAEFATAYTPYQPEVSQGTLQATFEFQSAIAALTGMEVANAGMYDGATAAAEAVLMTQRLRPGRPLILVARALHPHYRQVIATYLAGIKDVELVEVPYGPDGATPLPTAEQLRRASCLVLGYPNVFGVVEDLTRAAEVVHGEDCLLVSATAEALALALLRTPGAAGVDVAIAEGQSLGLPLGYGGPGLGLFASRERFVRSLPGRLVGETVDVHGRRGYVLTLATREQHIRRERATSNICTNQGLCAVQVVVYLSLLGRHGLASVAERNLRGAHALAERLRGVGTLRFSGPYFNELVLSLPDARRRWQHALGQGIVAGLPLGDWYPELEDTLLLCATELHDAAAMDRLAAALGADAAASAARAGDRA